MFIGVVVFEEDPGV